MKKIFPIIAASVAIASCSQEPENTFAINGSLTGFDSSVTKIYLNDENGLLDSSAVTDGRFAFKGVPDSARIFKLGIPRNIYGSALVFVDRGTVMNVKLEPQVTPSVEDNGGVNSIYTHFLVSHKALADSLLGNYQTLKQQQAPAAQIKAAKDRFQAGLLEHSLRFAQENAGNLAGALVLSQNCGEMKSLEAFDAAMKATTYISRFPGLDDVRSALERRLKTAPGKMFIDFKAKDVNGGEVSLSDYVGKGKYVLVDFWASWCGPCRREIPNLIEVQKRFGGKDFTVLGVDVWDIEDEFRKALKEENVNYPQMTIGKSREATQAYGISGIPQIILFGPDGKIVERDLRGDAIHALMETLLVK